ncbi:MAG: sugar phosphate isomerase/epimerase [Lentisphaeria bacterium]|nr:sugar phosphate isomerase/epimerase [Lentisphaeria bacterium]
MAKELIFNYSWKRVPVESYPVVIREFLDWGVEKLVFDDSLLGRAVKEPEFADVLRGLRKRFGVNFCSMHGLAGRGYDMDTLESFRSRRDMISDHVRALEIAAEFGSRTYTIHVGASHYVRREEKLPELMKLAADTLEKLVPAAERNGVVLAVENAFEPPNSARRVRELVEPYAGNEFVGVCFDTGHANIMTMKPGKEIEKFRDYMYRSWFETGLVFENDALEILKPYIVTTHMHDNDGYGDSHSMPFDGDTDWEALVKELKSCPRMIEYQSEVNFGDGVNWSGRLLAPPGGYSIKRLVETFRKIGF